MLPGDEEHKRFNVLLVVNIAARWCTNDTVTILDKVFLDESGTEMTDSNEQYTGRWSAK